jgi:hypothetical protein
MMPKSAKRFSDNIMLQIGSTDHGDFGSNRSKITVIGGHPNPGSVASFGATAIDAATARREAADLIRIYLSRLLNVTASD